MRLQVGSGGCAEVTLVTLEIILQGVQSVGNSLSKSKSLGNISSYEIDKNQGAAWFVIKIYFPRTLSRNITGPSN